MAEPKSIAFAVIIHFIFRTSLFIEFYNCPTCLSQIPSTVVLFGICMLLTDIAVMPERYKEKSSNIIHTLLESMICLFAIEFLMSIIWAKLEIFIEHLFKSSLSEVYGNWTNFVSSLIVFIFAVAFLSYSAAVTNGWEMIKVKIMELKQTIQSYINKRNEGPSGSGCGPVHVVYGATITKDACPVPTNGGGDVRPKSSIKIQDECCDCGEPLTSKKGRSRSTRRC